MHDVSIGALDRIMRKARTMSVIVGSSVNVEFNGVLCPAVVTKCHVGTMDVEYEGTMGSKAYVENNVQTNRIHFHC